MLDNHREDFQQQKNRKIFDKSDWRGALMKWNEYTSPFRPSKEDIKNYSSVLELLEKKEKILLLGSTPEIREILSKLGIFPVIADFSVRMISGMLHFNQRVIESKERWVRADWMDLDKFLKEDYFDVILGDIVLRNIEPNYQNKFLEKISRLLNANGYFVSRIHILNEDFVNLSSARIIRSAFEYFRSNKIKLADDLITSRLFDKNTDFKNKKVDKEGFAKDINRYIKKGVKDKREKLILNNISKRWFGPRTWTQRRPKEIDQLLIKYFIIRDISVAFDYKDSEFYPIHILKKY